MPVATGNADCCHVVGQPVLCLCRAVILGCVSRQGESLGESLGPNAVSETRRAGCSFPLLLLSSLQQVDAMPGIIVADLARSQPIADFWPDCRLPRPVIAPAADCRLFHSSARNRRAPIALDPALLLRLALLPVWARCIRMLASFRNRSYSSSRCFGPRNRVFSRNHLLLLRGCQQLTHSA